MSDAAKDPTYDERLEQLEAKEQRFVQEYLDTYNASLAARRVWPRYKASAVKGRKALQRPDVAAAVAAGLAEQRARLGIDPDRTMLELACVAFADPIDLLDSRGHVRPLNKMPTEIRRALSIEFDEETVEVEDSADGTTTRTTRTRVVHAKLAPKTQALELIAKRFKMLSDRLELSASDSLSALIRQAANRPPPPAPTETDA